MNQRMMSGQRFLYGAAFGLLSALGLAAMIWLVTNQKTQPLDLQVLTWVRGLHVDWLTDVMLFFTFVGSTEAAAVVTVVLLGLMYKTLSMRWELLFFVGVVAGSGLLNLLLKWLFQRPRPLEGLIHAGGFSFPSGHSMGAFALYGILVYLLWRYVPTRMGKLLLALTALAMILLIGGSRVYLGVHYPSDVIGGFLASACWLTLAVWYERQVRERRLKR